MLGDKDTLRPGRENEPDAAHTKATGRVLKPTPLYCSLLRKKSQQASSRKRRVESAFARWGKRGCSWQSRTESDLSDSTFFLRTNRRGVVQFLFQTITPFESITLFEFWVTSFKSPGFVLVEFSCFNHECFHFRMLSRVQSKLLAFARNFCPALPPGTV